MWASQAEQTGKELVGMLSYSLLFSLHFLTFFLESIKKITTRIFYIKKEDT